MGFVKTISLQKVDVVFSSYDVTSGYHYFRRWKTNCDIESSFIAFVMMARTETTEDKSPMEEGETTPREAEEFVERPSLVERISNVFHAVLGNGYDIFTKPHTATWIILFIAVAYYLCFVFEASMMF